MWDGDQPSQAYGLSYCPNNEDTADVGAFVDDLKTTTHGTSESHVEIHKNMGDNLIMDLKGFKAKVPKKNAILARRKKDSLALQKHYLTRGVKAAINHSAKYLGLANTGGGRRSMVTFKERVSQARKRANKVSWLNKKNKKLGPYTSQGFTLRRYMAWKE